MSQMATARALPKVAPVRAPRAPRQLRVIDAAPTNSTARLVMSSFVILAAGLIAVLLLNTSMARGAFTLTALQNRSSELADTESALRHAVDAQSAPAELAKRALDLGMVPAGGAAFLRVSDGAVLGVAEPATDKSGFTVVAQARPAAPAAPAGTAAPTADVAAAPAAPPIPESGTTVTTEGTITRTTVTVVRAGVVETTVTSVDSATGATTSTTSRTPAPAAASAAPAAAPGTPATPN